MKDALQVITRINFSITTELFRVASLPDSEKKQGLLCGLEKAFMQLKSEYKLLIGEPLRAEKQKEEEA